MIRPESSSITAIGELDLVTSLACRIAASPDSPHDDLSFPRFIRPELHVPSSLVVDMPKEIFLRMNADTCADVIGTVTRISDAARRVRKNFAGLSLESLWSCFPDHLNIMKAYAQVLDNHGVLDKLGVNRNFMELLIEIHDVNRRIGNPGKNHPLSLAEYDAWEADFIAKLMPDLPTKYLHDVKWLYVDDNSPLEGQTSFVKGIEAARVLPQHAQVALMLKAMDTLGKPNYLEDGTVQPHHPGTFFSAHGPYESWKQTQKELGRAERMHYNGYDVPFDEYTRTDTLYTQVGLGLMLCYIDRNRFDQLTPEGVPEHSIENSYVTLVDFWNEVCDAYDGM